MFCFIKVSVELTVMEVSYLRELENSAKKALCTFYNSIDTERAQAVDVMKAGAKRICILMIRVNKLFSFLCHGMF